MINNLFHGSTIGVLEQVVNFAQTRHGVLAGNIANLDTPGYKTRDLSPELFQQNLRKAIDARNEPRGSHASSPGRISEEKAIRDFEDVRESLKGILKHDGGDVSLERQITELSKNHGQHNMAISLMSSQFRLLESAISERVV
ncbi:MAG: flagellar basal body rod protein FlgB [Planctomycetota bacterium]